MSKVSLSQPELIESLREALKEEKLYDEKRHDEYYLRRFLRARQYRLPEATEMIVKAEQWRDEFGVQEIVKTFSFPEFEELQKVYPRSYHKTDKSGRPISIELLGSLNVKAMLQVTTSERMVKHYVREYEKVMQYRMAACSAARGERVEHVCSILDLKGLPLSQFNSARKVLSEVMAIAQNYYPETLGVMFLINAPTLFTTIWAIIKGWLDENTVRKIHVLGSNYQKVLLEHIDEENLPVMFGGKSPMSDNGFINDIGPWNDGTVEEYPIAFWEDFSKRDGEAA